MNVLVGPYYIVRDHQAHWTVRVGSNGVVVDDAKSAAAAAAKAKKLNDQAICACAGCGQ